MGWVCLKRGGGRGVFWGVLITVIIFFIWTFTVFFLSHLVHTDYCNILCNWITQGHVFPPFQPLTGTHARPPARTHARAHTHTHVQILGESSVKYWIKINNCRYVFKHLTPVNNYCLMWYILFKPWIHKAWGLSKKVKVAVRGLFSTAPCMADCTLAPEIVPSFISRGVPHQVAREASTSDGRKLNTRILPAPRNLLRVVGSFTCPKVGTWGRFNFPSERRHAEDFYIWKIQRLWPGLNPWTTRPPKLSWGLSKFWSKEL
jgi:hypothetical protein